jgi:hypothetical protein
MAKPMTQIKFTIDADIVAAFKARCTSTGASMASIIREWMSTQRPIKDSVPKISTRSQRRKAVSEIIGLLNGIFEMEEQYRDSIPEQFAQRYEQSDHTCEQLADAISLLEEVF